MTKKNKSNEEEILPETEIVEDDLVSQEEILPETEIVEEKTKKRNPWQINW